MRIFKECLHVILIIAQRCPIFHLPLLVAHYLAIALLERKGEKTAFIVSEGFRDLLHIGNQSRPDLFDLSAKRPGVLYEKVIEIKERVLLADVYELEGIPVVIGTSGERIQVEHVPGRAFDPSVFNDDRHFYRRRRMP